MDYVCHENKMENFVVRKGATAEGDEEDEQKNCTRE